MTIAVLPCTDGAFKIAPTTFNQHIFCSTRSNEIAMYHIPSKKLVKKFSGMKIFEYEIKILTSFDEFRSYIINNIDTINT